MPAKKSLLDRKLSIALEKHDMRKGKNWQNRKSKARILGRIFALENKDCEY